MARLELRSARLSPDLGNFRPSLSFCQVAQVFEDETYHSTCRSWVLKVEARHRPIGGVSPTVMGRFQPGWLVPASLQFAWTPLAEPSSST